MARTGRPKKTAETLLSENLNFRLTAEELARFHNTGGTADFARGLINQVSSDLEALRTGAADLDTIREHYLQFLMSASQVYLNQVQPGQDQGKNIPGE